MICLLDRSCWFYSNPYPPDSMWLSGGVDRSRWFKFKFRPKQVLEAAVRDDGGRIQGTIILEVIKHESTDTKGHWILASYVTASDQHLRWWMTEGEGQRLAKKGHFHLCEENSMDCDVTRRGQFMHLEKFRELTQKEIDQKVPGWAFTGPCKKSVLDYLKKADLGPAPGGEKGLLPWHESGEEEDDCTRSRTRSLSPGLKAKLKKAQEDLKTLEEAAKKQRAKDKGTVKPVAEGKPKKKDKPKPRRRKSRSPASGGDERGRRDDRKRRRRSASRHREEKKKKRKKKGEDRSSSKSKEDESSEDSKEERLFGEDVTAMKPEREKGAKKDRGPFGGGEALRFPTQSDSDSESFQDAPADRKASGQLKLASYARKKPGRLAARMLHKMVQESAHGSVGAAINEVSPTPPAAVHYLLTVMIPQLGGKANLRTQRELRTICTAIDMLAQMKPAQAADLLAQRVKALQKASVDGHWGSAQFLELLSPESATLLDRAEEVYTSNQYLLDQKLKSYDRQPKAPRLDGRGNQDKGGKKGREKGKGKGKEPDKKDMTP